MTTPYTVKKGDTLSIIARDQLDDWTRWPEISSLNNISSTVAAGSLIYLIYPGQILQLPEKQWVYHEESKVADQAQPDTSSPQKKIFWATIGFTAFLSGMAFIRNRRKRKRKTKS
jgi:LysM repeat protein